MIDSIISFYDIKKPQITHQVAMHDPTHSQTDVLTPKQLRAARALIGWSREQLGEKSGVPEITTRQFELGKTDPRQTTVHKWRRALEKAGVVFLDADDEWGPGVRLRGKRKD